MGSQIKKRYTAAGVLTAAVILLAVWLFTRPQPLAEIHRSFSSPETGSASASFTAGPGDGIRFRMSTRTESGAMEVSLLDESGALVYSFGSAKYQERRLTLAEGGIYTLEARFGSFTGTGEAIVYPEN